MVQALCLPGGTQCSPFGGEANRYDGGPPEVGLADLDVLGQMVGHLVVLCGCPFSASEYLLGAAGVAEHAALSVRFGWPGRLEPNRVVVFERFVGPSRFDRGSCTCVLGALAPADRNRYTYIPLRAATA